MRHYLHRLLAVIAVTFAFSSIVTAQTEAPSLPRYRFTESFQTILAPGAGFWANGIAVDNFGQIYMSAKDEGIVMFDKQRHYTFSFGYQAPEDMAIPVNGSGSPVDDPFASDSTRLSLRSPDGQPFVLLPNNRTISIAGHLFEPGCVATFGNGEKVAAVDNFTGWYQLFTSKKTIICGNLPLDDPFHKFTGLALLPSENGELDRNGKLKYLMYILDAHSSCLYCVDTDGKLRQTIGDKDSGEGKLYAPYGLALGPEKTIYVGDNGNHRIAVFGNDGKFLFAFGKEGDQAGQFRQIKGIALDNKGHVFTLENRRVQAFSLKGEYLGMAIGESPTIPSDNERAYIWGGNCIAVDRKGAIYVVDQTTVKIFKPVGPITP